MLTILDNINFLIIKWFHQIKKTICRQKKRKRNINLDEDEDEDEEKLELHKKTKETKWVDKQFKL